MSTARIGITLSRIIKIVIADNEPLYLKIKKNNDKGITNVIA